MKVTFCCILEGISTKIYMSVARFLKIVFFSQAHTTQFKRTYFMELDYHPQFGTKSVSRRAIPTLLVG